MHIVKKCYSRWDKMRTEVMTGDFLVQKCVDVALFSNPRKIKKAPTEVKTLKSVMTSHKIKDFPATWLTRGW